MRREDAGHLGLPHVGGEPSGGGGSAEGASWGGGAAEGWKLVKEKGYYVHLRSRFFWDPKTRLYYHKKMGWAKQLPVRAKGKGQGKPTPS